MNSDGKSLTGASNIYNISPNICTQDDNIIKKMFTKEKKITILFRVRM